MAGPTPPAPRSGGSPTPSTRKAAATPGGYQPGVSRPPAGRGASAARDAQADALDVRVVVQGLDALLPAVAAALVAAERHLHRLRGPRVDVDLAGLDRLGHPDGPRHVRGEDAARQPVVRVVGQAHGL